MGITLIPFEVDFELVGGCGMLMGGGNALILIGGSLDPEDSIL